MNLTQAIERARAMITPSAEDEALDLDGAIAEVRRIVAADDMAPAPDLDEAIRQVREILEQERRSTGDFEAHTLDALVDEPFYDDSLKDLLNAYVRSQCELHALIGAVALRSMRSPQAVFASQGRYLAAS